MSQAHVVNGYSRLWPVDRQLFLDASLSTDQDEAPSETSALSYTWACRVGSLTGFGGACSSSILSSSATAVAVRISALTMSANTTYIFTVSAYASDGRADSKDVRVRVTIAESVRCHISSRKVRFNTDEPLVSLTGAVNANLSVDARWSMHLFGNALNLTEHIRSQESRAFTAEQAEAATPFPLAFRPALLRHDRPYTFRLTTYPRGREHHACYAEITVVANGPPRNGYLNLDKTSGTPVTGNHLFLPAYIYHLTHSLTHSLLQTL